MKKLLQMLKNPSKEYRPIPFWSWNDKLDPEMLKWQINQMKETGHGGYFMHARGGLETEYLSDDWMECIKTCIEEGKKVDMDTWAYDENGWPSGFAGGLIPALGEKYHMRWMEPISVTDVSAALSDKSLLGIYLHDEKNNTIRLYDNSKVPANFELDNKIIAIKQMSSPYYIDILNHEVVKAFIDSTYEKYYDKFSEEFGTGLKGFFTDEPQYSKEKIPWSNILPSIFKERFDYEIQEILPKLFMEVKGYQKARYDFWSLVNELYVSSFGKQIYDWCEKHNCKLTGHSVQEGSMYNQMSLCAGVMPFYEYMQIPGIDWLGRHIDSPIVPKSLGSVANQLGKKFALTETFALCGWDVSFEELKWIAEWQYVNGVNLMCQHLESYSLKGLRKRDYPASLFYHQSWWEEYKLFNDFFSRLGMLLTEGVNTAKVLLIHPMKSGWIAYNWENNSDLQKLDSDFESATCFLSDNHIEHHYGDETIIARHGAVKDNKFVVGQCLYDAVILPSMITIDKNTIELLKAFSEVGGKVYSLGDTPTLCSGEETENLQEELGSIINADSKDQIVDEIVQTGIKNISILENNRAISSIHIQQRDLGDKKIYYLVNHNQKDTYHATITIAGNGKLSKLNLLDNIDELIDCKQHDNILTFDITFLPMQSHIIVQSKDNGEQEKMLEEKKQNIVLEDTWDIEDMGYNSLTLDSCSYCVDDGLEQEPIPVIKLMDKLMELKRSCKTEMRFTFETDMNLDNNNEMYLVIESPERYEIYINEHPVEHDGGSWWKDSAFSKIDIKKHVKNGINEVKIVGTFYQDQKVYDVLFGENVLETEKNKLTYNTEFESIYIVGDFGVISKSGYTYGERKAIFTDGPFIIIGKPSTVKRGSITEQGFCFFAETVTLSQDIEIEKRGNFKQILKIDRPNAVLTKIIVNDTEVKLLPWAPFEADVTDALSDGTNKVSIKLYSGNRNLLGPHHSKEGELYFVGPSSFTDKPGWAEGEKTDIWRNTYCFVKFGLS